MPAWAWVLIAIGIAVAVFLIVWAMWARRRTASLRDRFGPEYDRAIRERGDRRSAERELAARREHRASLDVRPLPPETRRVYADRWQDTQAKFVDAPSLAVTEADVLVQSVMRDRGYPIEDPAQRMADVSVDHPDVMDRFRAATAIAASARDDQASTEDLRRAMVHYRELFGRLLADQSDPGLERSA